ncbi:unnamed protein product [Lampetra planeri]
MHTAITAIPAAAIGEGRSSAQCGSVEQSLRDSRHGFPGTGWEGVAWWGGALAWEAARPALQLWTPGLRSQEATGEPEGVPGGAPESRGSRGGFRVASPRCLSKCMASESACSQQQQQELQQEELQELRSECRGCQSLGEAARAGRERHRETREGLHFVEGLGVNFGGGGTRVFGIFRRQQG